MCKKLKIKYILSFFLLWGAYTEGGAQEVTETEEPGHLSSFYEQSIVAYASEKADSTQFDRAAWARLVENIQYIQRAPKADKKPEKGPNISPSWNISSDFYTFFIALVISILVILAIYYFGKDIVLRRNDRVNTDFDVDFEALEDNLDRSDVQSVLSRALNAEQWAMAVRLYYLMVLQKLNEAGAIRWKKDKTNRSYKAEMASHALGSDFLDLTTIFEEVWYSDKTLNHETFKGIEVRFQRFFAALKA